MQETLNVCFYNYLLKSKRLTGRIMSSQSSDLTWGRPHHIFQIVFLCVGRKSGKSPRARNKPVPLNILHGLIDWQQLLLLLFLRLNQLIRVSWWRGGCVIVTCWRRGGGANLLKGRVLGGGEVVLALLHGVRGPPNCYVLQERTNVIDASLQDHCSYWLKIIGQCSWLVVLSFSKILFTWYGVDNLLILARKIEILFLVDFLYIEVYYCSLEIFTENWKGIPYYNEECSIYHYSCCSPKGPPRFQAEIRTCAARLGTE